MSIEFNRMPRNVIWFEEPKPVRWDPEFRMWNKDGFFDPQWNPETLLFSFKTDHFGVLGFCQNRWVNMPYQSWEFMPIGENRATFSITAAKMFIQFSIMKDLVCITEIKCLMPSEIVEEELLNQYMKPKLLIQRMRYHGLDIFPEFDSYAYMDGILIKNVETEDHLYRCIAASLPGFAIKSSKWNSRVSRDQFVYQMKEGAPFEEEGSMVEYKLLVTNSFKTKRIICKEDDEKFSEKEPEDEKSFHADLIHLTMAKGSTDSLHLMKETTPNFVETVRYLLYSIRPFSFS